MRLCSINTIMRCLRMCVCEAAILYHAPEQNSRMRLVGPLINCFQWPSTSLYQPTSSSLLNLHLTGRVVNAFKCQTSFERVFCPFHRSRHFRLLLICEPPFRPKSSQHISRSITLCRTETASGELPGDNGTLLAYSLVTATIDSSIGP
jgi:hypothetical protein